VLDAHVLYHCGAFTVTARTTRVHRCECLFIRDRQHDAVCLHAAAVAAVRARGQSKMHQPDPSAV
jgi:hypothetical protein